MDATGGNQANLTKRSFADVTPARSPDGHKIAFSSPLAAASAGICTMSLYGSNVMKLTANVFGDQQPVWSPDSSKIAFIEPGFHVDTETLVINADGSNLVLVADPFALHPTWAPDSKKLAYGSGPRQRAPDLHVQRRRTVADTPLTSSPEGADLPDWSPLSATGSS